MNNEYNNEIIISKDELETLRQEIFNDLKKMDRSIKTINTYIETLKDEISKISIFWNTDNGRIIKEKLTDIIQRMDEDIHDLMISTNTIEDVKENISFEKTILSK